MDRDSLDRIKELIEEIVDNLYDIESELTGLIDEYEVDAEEAFECIDGAMEYMEELLELTNA